VRATGRANKFDNIRAWEGSQDRAFEELCYQLFKSDVPDGSRPIRTGNPDGGVEWYATASDGTEVGWQAKNVRGIDALLTAMTKSVNAIVRDRPKAKKVVFLISWNLNTAVQGGAVKSQRQKYDDKIKSWKESIAGAKRIKFELIQGSDILDRLAQPEHRGREWFWWGAPVLTDEWMRSQLEEQIQAAEEKYRPALQVDLPIEADVAALGFDDSSVGRLARLCKSVASDARELRLHSKGHTRLNAAYDEIRSSSAALDNVCRDADIQVSTVDAELTTLQVLLEDFRRKHSAAVLIEHDLEDEWSAANPGVDTRYGTNEAVPTEARGFRIRSLSESVSELALWIDSHEGRALRRGFYFLEGAAGSGKTHLLLESTRRSLDAHRPAIFLSAARLGAGDLWAGICDQLGLPSVGRDVLLGAMDAAGEASAFTGRRFVIAIDALNETPVADFWHRHLPALRSAVSQWPHVALIVSCRDTYVKVVDDGNERKKFVTRKHPGFSGHEVDATQKYFAHYGLQAPRIPLLVPEFSLPLFLKLFCEGLKDCGSDVRYAGHEGRVAVFQRYLDAKLSRIARRLRPNASTSYELDAAGRRAASVLDALLDEFAATGREDVKQPRGEEIATFALGGDAQEAALVLGALQNEGILNLELIFQSDAGATQGFRILFQALADYMILRRRMDATADPKTDCDFHAWLAKDCNWGILESAAVVLPEVIGVELPDLLGVDARALERPKDANRDAYVTYNRQKEAVTSVVTMMPHRRPDAITERSVELFNDARRFVRVEDFFQIIFLMSPQPGNRLNGNALHRHLDQFSMPVRDSYFGFATYHAISDESSPAAALARWASNGPYPDYDDDVVELACIPLIWLLSSPNRFMRDWVTKALVQVLRGNLGVVARLLARFWPVNDPYVVQRVLVIAYGALMRSDRSDVDGARVLIEKVSALVFTPPVRADELMLDAARGVIEWGLAHGLVPKTYVAAIERPYGLDRPGPAPSEDTIDRKYGPKVDRTDNENYGTLRFSLMSMGDFGRYVVESAIREFSHFPRDKPYPEPEPVRESRLVKSRWAKFLRSLSEEQADRLIAIAAASDDSEESPSALDTIRQGFYVDLTSEQHELLAASWTQPRRRSYRDDSYPGDRACRWIFARVLRLGWTPQRFGEADRLIGYDRGGREAHKAERWGKKYQWIAFHELYARVADNFHMLHRGYADAEGEYLGLYQAIGDREIDPSLPPVPYPQLFGEEGRSDTWPESPVEFSSWPPDRIDFRRYDSNIDKFLADIQSEPNPKSVIALDDADGNKWIVLDAFVTQGDPSADRGWLGLQQHFSFHSWLVTASDGEKTLGQIARLRRDDRYDLVDTHGHTDCCYAGEIGWTPHRCYHRHSEPNPGSHGLPLVSTAESYCWEGNILDCSISESVSATMPSTFVQAKATLAFDAAGPSWSQDGQVVFTNLTEKAHGGRGLLVRASWLGEFLKAHSLEVVGAWWCERRFVGDTLSQPRDSDRRNHDLNVYTGIRVTEGLKITTSESVRELNGRESV
jgi:hypothetical protein